jgi:serine/threonine protein phosphatase PrpC
MRYVWSSGTDAGRVREHNEDSLFPATSGNSEGPVVLMVADGMGGAVAGEVASKLAVEAASSDDDDSPIEPTARVASANEAVIAATLEDPSLAGMGTTMTLLRLNPDGTADFAHVGDSRAYILTEGGIRLLTTDHTLINELVELGKITPKEAEHHPHRHMLTRVLGIGPIAIDAFSVKLQPGDRLLLCSDGLTTMVADFTIEQILDAGEGVEPTSWALIEQANTAGGVDNTTVVVIDVLA